MSPFAIAADISPETALTQSSDARRRFHDQQTASTRRETGPIRPLNTRLRQQLTGSGAGRTGNEEAQIARPITLREKT